MKFSLLFRRKKRQDTLREPSLIPEAAEQIQRQADELHRLVMALQTKHGIREAK